MGKCARSQSETDCLAFSGIQCYLCKLLQFPHGADHLHLLRSDIELHHRLAGTSSCVGHSDRDGQFFTLLHLLLIQRQPAVLESGIAQAMAKGEQYFLFPALIITISYKQTLIITDGSCFAKIVQEAWIVLQPLRESLRQMS